MTANDPYHFDIDGFDDHTDEAEQERIQQKNRRLTEQEDIRWLMSNKQGRRIVKRLLGLAQIYTNPFSTDPNVTAFNCGRAVMGQTLFAEINTHSFDDYLKMLSE